MSTAVESGQTDLPAEPHAHHRAFGRAYWMLNSIEMFERLAYFGIRAVVPLYIMQATEPGGLHLTAVHKGAIYAWWAVFQSILPIFTGGIADRYGYKRVLAFAISMNAIGYVMMANFHDYVGFFAGILVLATGTAFFKPSLQGSIAQGLTKKNSSLGWGIFYWVVNVGAFAAPFVSTLVLGKPHSQEGWRTLFYLCAGFTACNLFLLLTFRDVPSGADKTESPWAVLKRTIANIFEIRLIIWLMIMSCFWLMMYQLWDLHPNFITDWVNSQSIAERVPFDAWWEYGDRGIKQVPQQILLNLNAGLIILLIVPLSWAARKMRTLSAMLVGMSVATCGVLVAGLTGNGWILLLGIVFFSLGEMWTGPKKNEYLGLIAPPGKKALYLGYVNIPVGVGLFVGSYLAGFVYDRFGEKASLALKEMGSEPKLAARAAQAADWSHSLDQIPKLLHIERGTAFGKVQDILNRGEEATARTLRMMFRHDRGQTINLGYRYLALEPEYRPAVKEGLAAELRKRAEDLDFEITALNEAGANGADPADDDDAPTSAALARRAAELRDLAFLVETDKTPLAGEILGVYGRDLPDWIGKTRAEVLDVVRESVNKGRPSSDRKEDAEIAAMLWTRFGSDPVVLNNLALEYLAQGTPLLREAVERMKFEDPVKDIPKKIGIDRTEAFAALSAAMGADEARVRRVLEQVASPRRVQDQMGPASADLTDRVYTFLAGRDHVRFIAVAKKNWTRDVGLLRDMIESDPVARRLVERQIDEHGWSESLVGAIRRLFGREPERDIYRRLAVRPDLIQKALKVKDWSQTPEQAAQLLQMNPLEAWARAAAEINEAPRKATKLLWDKYDPQYKVWIPFAAIGVVATIALGIFGQMAKRWKDMNA
jgi:MFS family permease